MKHLKRNEVRKYHFWSSLIFSGMVFYIFCMILRPKMSGESSEILKIRIDNETSYTYFNKTDKGMVSNGITSSEYAFESAKNITKKSVRNKRFIIFNGNGVVKLVIGVSFPIQLADPVRSLSYFYNLQMQYTPAPRPLYIWSPFNTTTFPGFLRKSKRNSFNPIEQDLSREYLYTAIEKAFDSAGMPGTQCLLKMICEIARLPFYVPRNDVDNPRDHFIFHELLNAIFTPIFPNVDAKYLQAYHIGNHGANCNYVCPKYKNWLKRFSFYV